MQFDFLIQFVIRLQLLYELDEGIVIQGLLYIFLLCLFAIHQSLLHHPQHLALLHTEKTKRIITKYNFRGLADECLLTFFTTTVLTPSLTV